MLFSRTRKHASVSLDGSQRAAVLSSPTQPRFGKTVLASSPLKDQGIYQWSVRIDDSRVMQNCPPCFNLPPPSARIPSLLSSVHLSLTITLRSFLIFTSRAPISLSLFPILPLPLYPFGIIGP